MGGQAQRRRGGCPKEEKRFVSGRESSAKERVAAKSPPKPVALPKSTSRKTASAPPRAAGKSSAPTAGCRKSARIAGTSLPPVDAATRTPIPTAKAAKDTGGKKRAVEKSVEEAANPTKRAKREPPKKEGGGAKPKSSAGNGPNRSKEEGLWAKGYEGEVLPEASASLVSKSAPSCNNQSFQFDMMRDLRFCDPTPRP